MIGMRAFVVSLKDNIKSRQRNKKEFSADPPAPLLAHSSTLRPSMPKLSCLTDK